MLKAGSSTSLNLLRVSVLMSLWVPSPSLEQKHHSSTGTNTLPARIQTLDEMNHYYNNDVSTTVPSTSMVPSTSNQFYQNVTNTTLLPSAPMVPSVHPSVPYDHLVDRIKPWAVDLEILQQPSIALVALEGKERLRKPIDPPPIVQLRLDASEDPGEMFLSNPYLFMCATLRTAHVPVEDSKALPGKAMTGTVVSSLHRLKDPKDKQGAFFIFGDMSARITGHFYLEFTLYELRKDQGEVLFVKSVLSKPFKVVQPKDFPGMGESTYLSRAFSDQGVRLRLRKESRSAGQKRQYDSRGDENSTDTPPSKRTEYDYSNNAPMPLPTPPTNPLVMQHQSPPHSLYSNPSANPMSLQHQPQAPQSAYATHPSSAGTYWSPEPNTAQYTHNSWGAPSTYY